MTQNLRIEGAAAVAFLCVLTCSAPAWAQTSSERPGYTLLRYQENWSVLQDLPEGAEQDLWDPIKYIPLSEDGSVWLSFGGSARLRWEQWWNFAFLPSSQGDDGFLLSRALVHADLHVGKNVRAFAQGDSAFSTDRDLPGGRRTLDVDSIDLQQGFVDVRMPFADDATITLRAGRQAFLFGKQRLVSPLPWANAMRSWDGVSVILEAGSWNVQGFWSQFAPTRKYEFNRADAQTQFYGVYATDKLNAPYAKGLDLYFLGLSSRDTTTVNGTTGTQDRYTLGARLWGDIGDSPFDYGFEGAYQFGRVGSGDVEAYMIGTKLGYTPPDWSFDPWVFVGLEMGSGDNRPGGDVQTFNQLFPLGHAYFGHIDAIGRQNAIDLNFGARCSPIDKLGVGVTGHFFWRDSTDDALYNAGGGVVRAGNLGSSSEIGQEIDLTVTYSFDRHTTAQLGYSHFFSGDFIEQSGPSHDTDFLYLQLRYVF